jgi:hypothetical protein
MKTFQFCHNYVNRDDVQAHKEKKTEINNTVKPVLRGHHWDKGKVAV